MYSILYSVHICMCANVHVNLKRSLGLSPVHALAWNEGISPRSMQGNSSATPGQQRCPTGSGIHLRILVDKSQKKQQHL